jgi:hypothetical protein
MDTFFTIVMILLLVFALFLLGIAGVVAYQEITKTEVETYTVGCEVTKTAYAEETTGPRSSRPSYKMGVRCDDFATTFEITGDQYAQYNENDIVEVEVTVWEYSDGTLKNTYKLIG